MNHYITGSTIKALREKLHLTQSQLAEKLCVSDKAVSKWETGKGFPDISLIEPLASALKVSIPELLTGEQIMNANRSANMMKSKLYICPICGNILCAAGAALVSCCGVTLPPEKAEGPDDEHRLLCKRSDDEYSVSIAHPMTKEHYISFVAYCTDERFELVKLYPEGKTEINFFSRGRGQIYWYCNHHGLFCMKV